MNSPKYFKEEILPGQHKLSQKRERNHFPSHFKFIIPLITKTDKDNTREQGREGGENKGDQCCSCS